MSAKTFQCAKAKWCCADQTKHETKAKKNSNQMKHTKKKMLQLNNTPSDMRPHGNRYKNSTEKMRAFSTENNEKK